LEVAGCLGRRCKEGVRVWKGAALRSPSGDVKRSEGACVLRVRFRARGRKRCPGSGKQFGTAHGGSSCRTAQLLNNHGMGQMSDLELRQNCWPLYGREHLHCTCQGVKTAFLLCHPFLGLDTEARRRITRIKMIMGKLPASLQCTATAPRGAGRLATIFCMHMWARRGSRLACDGRDVAAPLAPRSPW
jgi:hypothetical protein